MTEYQRIGLLFGFEQVLEKLGQWSSSATRVTSVKLMSFLKDRRTQFETADNLAPQTIWHCSVKWTIWHHGQFRTTDNFAPWTIWHRTIWHRTIWHRSLKVENLAPQCKMDNLALRTIWHHGKFGTLMKCGQFGTTV